VRLFAGKRARPKLCASSSSRFTAVCALLRGAHGRARGNLTHFGVHLDGAVHGRGKTSTSCLGKCRLLSSLKDLGLYIGVLNFGIFLCLGNLGSPLI
jgi:hypothetical protein